jgi:hypothetical protein
MAGRKFPLLISLMKQGGDGPCGWCGEVFSLVGQVVGGAWGALVGSENALKAAA